MPYRCPQVYNDGFLYESVCNKNGVDWRWKKVLPSYRTGASYNYKSLTNMSPSEIRKEDKRLFRWLEKVTGKQWDVNASDSVPIQRIIREYNNLKSKNFNGLN